MANDAPPEGRKMFGQSAYGYAIDRLRSLQVRRAVDGDSMLLGWKREEAYHQFVKDLIEWVDQQRLEKAAEDEKYKGRGRR